MGGKVITLELLGLGSSIYFACCYIFVVPRSCSKIKVSRAKMYFISLSFLGGKGCVKVKIMSRSNCKNRFLSDLVISNLLFFVAHHEEIND